MGTCELASVDATTEGLSQHMNGNFVDGNSVLIGVARACMGMAVRNRLY